MKMKKKGLVSSLAVIFLCLGIACYCTRPTAFGAWRDTGPEIGKLYTVAHVNDGDTFIVRGEGVLGAREYTVRMLGVDTPEVVDPRKPVQCYGPEASAETKSLLGGRWVRFEISAGREAKDKYGRYLMYVYRDDGLFVNEELLRKGYAREYTYGKAYSRQREFKSIEESAKEKGVGLWAKCQSL